MTTTEQKAGDRYLIRKRGAFYRPNAEGYTNNKAEAGRYTLAQAISHSHPNGPDGPRDGIDYVLADEPAAPCLASVSSASAEGFVLVPREPTEAMLEALHRDIRIKVDPALKIADIMNEREVWSAMLAASPEPVPASIQAGEVEAAGRNLYLLQGDNSRMADALRKCRDQFAFYAREHYAAGKSDKGDTNTRFAGIATKALEAVKPYVPATQPATSQPEETWMNDPRSLDAGLPSGTFACPICGDDKPHHHTAPVVDAYQTKGSRK